MLNLPGWRYAETDNYLGIAFKTSGLQSQWDSSRFHQVQTHFLRVKYWVTLEFSRLKCIPPWFSRHCANTRLWHKTSCKMSLILKKCVNKVFFTTKTKWLEKKMSTAVIKKISSRWESSGNLHILPLESSKLMKLRNLTNHTSQETKRSRNCNSPQSRMNSNLYNILPKLTPVC